MSNISTDLQDVEKIIVLDYGSQYNQLISRRIREIGVFSELKTQKSSNWAFLFWESVTVCSY